MRLLELFGSIVSFIFDAIYRLIKFGWYFIILGTALGLLVYIITKPEIIATIAVLATLFIVLAIKELWPLIKNDNKSRKL